MAKNITLILLGASGDLSTKMIIPAIYNIFANKNFDNFIFIAAALEKLDINNLLNKSSKYIKNIDQKIWQEFISISKYYTIDLKQTENYKILYNLITEEETKYILDFNRLIYCATGSDLFLDITENLIKTNIIQTQNNNYNSNIWHRIAYEKPLGNNLRSATKINNTLKSLLNKQQIFYVDHYLAKLPVQNILPFRFSNNLFDSINNPKIIERIEIILDESISIENRGKYYDSTGALKDVVQNHMLQLLALITIDNADFLDHKTITDKKAEILKKLIFITGFLGQYEGYTEELYVNKNSKTETFALLKLKINKKNLKHIDIILRTGKCLSKKDTSILIKFKNNNSNSENLPNNILNIEIATEPGLKLSFNIKDQKSNNIKQINHKINLVDQFANISDYQIIIQAIIEANKFIFADFEEIKYCWKLIDKIKKQNLKLITYKKNSIGSSFKL